MAIVHKDPFPYAGQTVKLRKDSSIVEFLARRGHVDPDYDIEDYWDRLTGRSWMQAGNPASLQYVERWANGNLPTDDNVVYGKVGALGYLVHVSELDIVGSSVYSELVGEN